MLRDTDPTKFAGLYVVCGSTDMRYDMDHLAAIIETRYHLSLFVPNTLFFFCGKHTNKIKGLVWEGDGFLLHTKGVEEDHFSWPRTSSEARSISPHQFEWLMQGFSIDPIIKDSYPKSSA